jgi:transposase
MNKKYRVTLTEEERSMLKNLISSGKTTARTVNHAHILLKADESKGGPGWTDERINYAFGVSLPTIARVRQRFVEKNIEAALYHKKPKNTRKPILDGEKEARLITLACSTPPAGHARWTLRMLADKMVELEYVDTVSHETVRTALKKTKLKPGLKNHG